jgi:hypothetical protein
MLKSLTLMALLIVFSLSAGCNQGKSSLPGNAPENGSAQTSTEEAPPQVKNTSSTPEYQKIIDERVGPVKGFHLYSRPSLPEEEWPEIPEIVKKNHSWNKIPRYLAIYKNTPIFGEWTEAELRTLAAHDIIQLSTPTENADRCNLAAELKRRNPNIIILGYRNLCLDYTSMDGQRFKDHPDWYLKDRQTGEYVVHGENEWQSRRPVYDIRKPEVREWWVQDIDEQLNLPNFDGVLIDAFAKAVVRWWPRVRAVGNSPEELLEANESLHILLEDNIKRNGRQGVVIGNALRPIYHDCLKSYVDAYLHGSYLENIEQLNEHYERTLGHLIDTCIQMQNEGGQKLMCITMTCYDPPRPADQNDGGAKMHLFDEVKSEKPLSPEETMALMRKNFEYKLAIALTMASDYFYFGYAMTHGANNILGLYLPDYPEFKRPLGKPLGPAVKTGPYAYERKFKHVSVKLDVAARKGKIEWK